MSKKKTLPNNILKLKNQFESGNNLIDYFLVCGCDPSIYFTEKKLFNLTNDKTTNLNNLSRIIKPKLISKFPEFDNSNDTIDNNIISYCFPYGFKPYYKDSGNKIMEKQFSIILDNNLFSSEYPQKYMTCLLFYENLAQYKELYDEIFGDKNNPELSESNDLNSYNNDNIDTKKSNSESKYNEDLKRSISVMPKEASSKYVRSFTKTYEPEVKALNKSLNVSKYKYYFIPKCICLISIHPYIKLFKEILFLLYKYSLLNQKIPIEKIITNLLIEVPIPPRGLYSIDFTLINSIKTLQRTENNKLLLTEIDLKKFYNNIHLDIQLQVLKHLIYGSKIIFFSKNINNLTESILAFLFLLFPFKFPFQVTSYLNKNNYNILESISPFFIGINEAYNSDFFTENDISIEGMDLLVVDIDNNKYELLSGDSFPEFPSKIVNNLIKDIKSLEKKYITGEVEVQKEEQEEESENVEETEEKEEKEKIEKKEENKKENEDTIDIFNKNYQETFFFFMCELIKNYEDYLNMNYFKNTKDVLTSIETLFNCDHFIKYHQSSDIPFYTKFVKDSQLFADFIYKRMIPKNNQEIIDVLLVNDTLTRIRNKNKFFGKDATDFSNSTEYLKKNKYIVPKARDLSEKEKNFINKNIEKLNKKGQIIIINSSDFSFKYALFPKLDFDIYCNNDNASEYIPPPDYSEEIESINVDVISKSSIGQNMNRSLEMINYLYLSWLEVWAFTFKYIDKKERPYRFNQMIDILNKVIHHEMNILNLLFDALSRNSENDMILKLYRKLIDLNINPSSFIYSIISSVIDKTQMRELKELKISLIKLDDNIIKYKNCNINNIQTKNNLKRTFSSFEDYLEINQNLKFYSTFPCIKCGKKINLLNICKNFAGVKNDILWVPCKCGEYNLPKMQVRYGSELLRDKIYKTSSLDDIVIHSPCDLKINIKNAVMKNYGTELIVPEFKSKFKPLFWNFIWYCKIHKLDYEIILPYLKDIQQLRQIKYQNRAKEIFEINYEDKNYSDNLDKIKKYSKNIYDRFVNNKTIKKIMHTDNINIVNEIKLEFIEEKKLEIKSDNGGDEEFKEKNEEEENSSDKEKEKDENIDKEINQEVKLDKINSDIKNVVIEEKEENEEKEEKEEIEEKNEIAKEDNNNNLDNQQNEEFGDNYIDNNNEEQVEKEGQEKEEEVKEVEEKEVQEEGLEKNEEEKVEEKDVEEKEEEIEVEEMKPEQSMFNEEENEVKEEEKNEINSEQEEEQEKIQEQEQEQEPEQEQEQEQEEAQKETNIISETNNKKEEPKEEENQNNIINIEKKFKKENRIMGIKQSDLNVQLKKVMELRQSQRDPDEININLKKLDQSLLIREPEAQKTINYQLKKINVENLSQSTVSNVNKGEDFLAELKKKLKKVDKKNYKQ